MSNKINNFKSMVNSFISIDDKIKEYQSKINQLKNEKDIIEDNIITTIKNNNLEDKDIKLGNNKLRYESRDVKDSLTQTFIKNSLVSYFNQFYKNKLSPDRCEEKADEIFKYILSLRQTKEKYTIKRITI